MLWGADGGFALVSNFGFADLALLFLAPQ